jgi:hypothetical protein
MAKNFEWAAALQSEARNNEEFADAAVFESPDRQRPQAPGVHEVADLAPAAVGEASALRQVRRPPA